MSSREKAIAHWILACLIAGTSVLFWREFFREQATSSWRATEGKIIAVSDDATINGEGLKYSYSVRGRTYVGHRIAFNDFHLPKSWSDTQRTEWIKKTYSVGKTLRVYFDPSSPNEAVLMKQTTEEGAFGSAALISGAALLFLGFGGCHLDVRKHNKGLNSDAAKVTARR